MNDNWHIPRASLAPSSNTASSAVSSISSSNRSNRSDALQLSNTTQQHFLVMPMPASESSNKSGSSGKHTKRQPQYSNKTTAPNTPRPSSSVAPTTTTTTPTTPAATTTPSTNPAITAAAAAAVLAAAAVKRGSRSSQGSSDSNNSTRSAASGSLLLTAANLERFAEIQKKQHKDKQLAAVHQQQQHHHHHHVQQLAPQQYNANLLHATKQQQLQQVYTVTHPDSSTDGAQQTAASVGDTIITMDPNLNFIKTKDLDTVSIASSMHFTMVNGDIGQAKKPKRGLCDRGRQVTVLIVSMSTIFLLLIMGMVYALEMRAREMPQS